MPEALAQTEPRPYQVTAAEQARIAVLSALGMSQRDIATTVQRSRQSVINALRSQEFTEAIAEGRSRLHAAIPELTDGTINGCLVAADKGKPEAAIEVLTRLEVLPPAAQAGPSVAIAVGFMPPGTPQMAGVLGAKVIEPPRQALDSAECLGNIAGSDNKRLCKPEKSLGHSGLQDAQIIDAQPETRPARRATPEGGPGARASVGGQAQFSSKSPHRKRRVPPPRLGKAPLLVTKSMSGQVRGPGSHKSRSRPLAGDSGADHMSPAPTEGEGIDKAI